MLAVHVCCFNWMRQQLLWDFFGTATASQVVWYTFTCKIKKTGQFLKLQSACCNYSNLRNTGLFHLECGENSMSPPVLWDQSGTTEQSGWIHSISQGHRSCPVPLDPPTAVRLSSVDSWHGCWLQARFVQLYDSEFARKIRYHSICSGVLMKNVLWSIQEKWSFAEFLSWICKFTDSAVNMHIYQEICMLTIYLGIMDELVNLLFLNFPKVWLKKKYLLKSP